MAALMEGDIGEMIAGILDHHRRFPRQDRGDQVEAGDRAADDQDIVRADRQPTRRRDDRGDGLPQAWIAGGIALVEQFGHELRPDPRLQPRPAIERKGIDGAVGHSKGNRGPGGRSFLCQ